MIPVCLSSNRYNSKNSVMKNVNVLSVLLLVLFGSCTSVFEINSCNIGTVTDSIVVNTFSKIEVLATEIQYIPSEENKVIWSACEHISDCVKVSVKDGILELGLDEGCERSKCVLKFVVYGNENLADIYAMGACQFIYKGDIISEKLDVDVSGASRFGISGKIGVGKLDVDCSGASVFEANDVECVILDVDVSGASGVRLQGKCDKADYDASGTSCIHASGMISENVAADASGCSKISCYASGNIRKSTSGMSTVKYETGK